MKIATYNIWNSDRGMPFREQQIINQIKAVDADIICLQEVKQAMFDKLAGELTVNNYSFYHYLNDEYTGLAVFSKFPIVNQKHFKCSIFVTCEYQGNNYLVGNVHFPWQSILEMEQLAVDINREVEGMEFDYALLTGDFNCSGDSSVHHFLRGDRSLLNSEANRWDDLAEVYSEITDTRLENTLDLRTNPRWKGNTACTSGRVDRIYIRDTFPKPFLQLKSFALFGKTIDEQSGYCASDHYGVVAEIDLP